MNNWVEIWVSGDASAYVCNDKIKIQSSERHLIIGTLKCVEHLLRSKEQGHQFENGCIYRVKDALKLCVGESVVTLALEDPKDILEALTRQGLIQAQQGRPFGTLA